MAVRAVSISCGVGLGRNPHLLFPRYVKRVSVCCDTLRLRASQGSPRSGPMHCATGIVPVDGFFEWRAIRSERGKQPYAL